MAGKPVSQRTIVELVRVLRQFSSSGDEFTEPISYSELLYEHDFPDWFVIHAKSQYGWDWMRILMDVRSRRFFMSPYSHSHISITGKYLPENEMERLGEELTQRLAALATTLPTGESVLFSLHLDGFDVDQTKLTLVPLEGPVSAREEEDRLTRLVRNSGLPGSGTVLKHIVDAQSLYAEGKDHPSLN